jgi:molybdate transport system substrate-binding protein
MKFLKWLALPAVAWLSVHSANAAELKLLVSEIVHPAIAELAAQFEKKSGHKLTVEYGFGVQQTKRAQEGEAFDLIISPAALVKDPATLKVLMPDTIVEPMRVGQGVAVKKGAAKPEISSNESLKQTLLKAQSVTFVPNGASGKQTLAMFERLGITEEMKPKIKAKGPSEVAATVASGEAELALFYINNLVAADGVDYVGPYPGDLQQFLSFAAAVSGKSANADAAKAFIQFIAAPEAANVIRAKGMEPG